MGKKYLAPKMGAMMAEKIKSEPDFGAIDLIVPVPISPNSFQVRGFNQTELLAKQIGKELGIKVDNEVIFRVKDTPHQTELIQGGTREKLLCAFEVREKRILDEKHIVGR